MATQETTAAQTLQVTNTDCLADLEGGFLRMRVSHQCNCKCEFCYQNDWSATDYNAQIPNEWLYDYCTPLYGRVKTILTGGGEITFAKEGYNFCKFLAENYPQTNVLTESNGILYNEKWQNLAVESLFMQHFSLNAACGEIYEKAVWKDGGKAVYSKVLSNITALAKKWQDAGMSCFTPSISMVVNKNSVSDIYDFIKLALKLKLKGTFFYFDHREGSVGGASFVNPEIMENALKTLMKIERILAKKFNVYFRLWLPMNVTQKLQAEVEAIPIEELKEEFAELLELAKDRDMVKEWEERNKLRQERGKKTLSIKEDYFPALYSEDKLLSDGSCKTLCMAPHKSLDIFANGKINLCGWVMVGVGGMANLYDYVKNNTIDWVNVLNLPIYQDMRSQVLKDNFSYCMDCCPLHPKNPHLNDIMKYGLGRETP